LRLCRVAAIAALTSALVLAGCSYRLASLVSRDDSDFATTGSVTQPADGTTPVPARSGAAGASDADLAYARAAAANVLARGAKDSSVPWQNPQTGAGGNITPLDTSYSEDGHACRDFLASYMHGTEQDWLQGAACRTGSGSWEVMRLTPLKPS
jgi:surface antigen